jgi:hypothetical protein
MDEIDEGAVVSTRMLEQSTDGAEASHLLIVVIGARELEDLLIKPSEPLVGDRDLDPLQRLRALSRHLDALGRSPLGTREVATGEGELAGEIASLERARELAHLVNVPDLAAELIELVE